MAGVVLRFSVQYTDMGPGYPFYGVFVAEILFFFCFVFVFFVTE